MGSYLMRLFLKILVRIFCHLGLAFVLSGLAAMIIVSGLGVCPRFDEGAISCTTSFYTGVAQFAMTVMLLTVFTGLPALLALGGAVFLVIDLRRWWRRRAA